MSVYRRPDSPYWWLWLETAPVGQQREKTQILVGTTRKAIADSRADALAVYQQRMAYFGRVAHALPVDKPAITFGAFVDWYDAHVVEHHRGKVREREILTGLRTAFAGRALHTITQADVLEWRTARAAKTSASTSNRELDVLKHLFVAAVPTYLEVSPIAGLKRLRPVKRETRVLTRAEETRLLAELSVPDQALVLCALDTLMRLSDVVNLRRDQDRGSYLLVVDPKVTPYQVPVSARLRKALDALPGDDPYYFPHRRKAENARDYKSGIKSMLKRACAACTPKIPYGRKIGGLTFHGLRHTGTTRLVDAGVSLRIVQALGGWSSMRQLERYAHPTEAAKRDAVEQIGAKDSRATPVTPMKRKKPARKRA